MAASRAVAGALATTRAPASPVAAAVVVGADVLLLSAEPAATAVASVDVERPLASAVRVVVDGRALACWRSCGNVGVRTGQGLGGVQFSYAHADDIHLADNISGAADEFYIGIYGVLRL